MKPIRLNHGQTAWVDDEDYDRVAPYNWRAVYSDGTNSFYACVTVRVGGSRITIAMQRAVLRARKGTPVDHESHDTLDNRKVNLRMTTPQGNTRNRRLAANNTSGACGVRWYKKNKKWAAQITVDGKSIFLGMFRDKCDAITARDEANVKYGFHQNHGRDFARHSPPGAVASPNKSRRLFSTNSSGVCGVCWIEERGKWRADIQVYGRSIFLGHFTDKADAIKARTEANDKYGFSQPPVRLEGGHHEEDLC